MFTEARGDRDDVQNFAIIVTGIRNNRRCSRKNKIKDDAQNMI